MSLKRLREELLRLRSSRCGAVTFVQRYDDALNANVWTEAATGMRLEMLIRYAARLQSQTERLTALPDGRLFYRLKRPWRDGTSAVVFERQDFMSKLAVLVPTPRAHLTRLPTW